MKSLRYLLFWLVSGVGVYAQIPVKDVTSLQYVDTRTLRSGSKIQLGGYYTNGDNGGGDLYWDSTSTATTNGGTVFMPASGVGRFIRDLQGQPITPKMFGARADGTTPDDTYFQGARNYATANNIALRITPGQYMVSNVLIWNTNFNVIQDLGAEIIRPAAATDYTFRVQPASTPTYQQVLASDVREGNTSIYLTDTNGFVSGQWIIIRDRSTRNPNGTVDDNPNMEINQILRIETNRVDLLSHIQGDYRTANTNEIAIIGELSVKAYGLKVTLITNNTTAGGIFMNYVTGGQIDGLHVEGNRLPGVHFQRSSRVKVSNSTVRRGTGIEIGGTGYGFYASRSSHDITFENCFSEGVRENQVDSGARNITWIGCRAKGHYDDGFNTHGQGCRNIKFIGCTVNETRGYGILAAFEGANYADTYVDIIGCDIRANLSAIYAAYTTGTNKQIRILNNTLQGQRWAIEIGAGGEGLEIANNRCTPFGESLTGGGIWITNTVGAHIHDNKLQGYLSSGFILGVGCSNNIIRNTEFIDLFNTSAMIVAGNANILDGVSLIRCASAGVMDTGSRNRWSRFDAADMASGQALMFNGSVDPVLDGFSFRNVANAILLTNLTKATVRNGTIVAATNSTNPVKLYASNVGFENVTWDGTYATNSNDTAVYIVSGTNNTFTACKWNPAALFDNCVYLETGVQRTTILDSFMQDGCVARMIGGSNITMMTLRGNTFRNSPSYPIRPTMGSDWTIIGNTFENTPVWAISAVNGVTNAYIAFNTFRGYSTTNATLFPNRSLVVETMNYYGSTPETFWSIPAITNGLPSFIPTNNVFLYAIMGSSGPEIWGLRYNGSAYETNKVYPAASALKVDGATVTNPDFGDTAYIDIDSSGSSVTAELALTQLMRFLATNLVVAGANITAVVTDTNVTLSSSGGGGATNGTAVSLNGSAAYTLLNLINSAEIAGTTSGASNVYFSLVASSIATNKIDSTFWNWISNKLTTPSGTNGQVMTHNGTTWVASNAVAGGGTTYTGTNGVSVSGSVISANLIASNNIALTTNVDGSLSIAAVVSTNSGTTAYVDTAGPQSVLNFSDGGGIGFTLTGTNLTADVEANAVALATDTTGNYVATITGTANQITVSGSGSENAAVTLSLPSSIDVGTLNIDTLNLSNRLTTNVLSVSTSPVIIGRTLGGSGVAQELTLTGAGAVTVYTNAGGIIVSNPVVAGGGGGLGTNIIVGASTLVQPAHLVDSPNVTWAVTSSTNISATFSGVGSNTNGYYVKSASQIVNTSNAGEATILTTSVPSGTLSEDGDELEVFIPGKFINNSGSTAGYTWRLNFGIASPHLIGVMDDDFANLSSARATDWRFRFKRKDATTIQSYVTHFVGTDSTAYSTNALVVAAYDESETVSDLSANALDITFTIQNTDSHASLGHTLFGYTILKIGAQGTGSGGGLSGSDIQYAVRGPGTSVTQYKTMVWADTTGTNATEAAMTFSGGSTRTNASLSGVLSVDTLRVNYAQTNLAGSTLGVGGTLLIGTTNVQDELARKAQVAVNGTNVLSFNLTNNETGDWIISDGSNVVFRYKFNNRHGAVWSDAYQQGGASSANSLIPFGGVAISSGTVGQQGGETNHPGIVRITSASGANSGYYYGTGTSDVTMDAPWGFLYTFRLVQTNDQRNFMGGIDSTSTSEPTDGWYLDNQFGWAVAVSAVGGSRSYSSTSNQLATNTWYTLAGWIPDRTQANLELFNSDSGSSVASWTLSSPGAMANITNRFGWGITTFRTNSTATALLDIDFMGVAPVDTIRR